MRWLDFAAAGDVLRRSFWVLPALAMLIGGALGFVVPMLDSETNGEVGPFTTSDPASARGLLETIATVTVSVAGIAFSVTVIALQLASQQLGPRVLRTFETDRLSQTTLAVFLGVFVYALIALGRLSTITLDDGANAPNLVLTVGVFASVLAFGLFTAFIQNIVLSLQASTMIRRIASDAAEAMSQVYPGGIGSPPPDESPSVAEPRTRGRPTPVRAPRAGFLNLVAGDEVIEAAATREGLVAQRVLLGDFVTEGLALADVYASGDGGALADEVSRLFEIGQERTIVHDPAFPIRQLADVALRGLSPSLNDPTTAENAMGSVAHLLAMFARLDPVRPERADADGVTRLIAAAPGLDDLVRLAFEQVRIHSEGYPVLSRRLGELLEEVRRVAKEHGRSTDEIDRQLGAL